MLKWLSPLIFALPVAMVGIVLGWRPAVIFVLALAALVPLAGIIGHYTEHLGTYYGDVASGLLDASFGNAPEIMVGLLLIIGVFKVVDAPVIVLALIVGSVVSNALFVLGTSVFVGALRNGRMSFDTDRAGSYASMLALAVAGLALPALAVDLGNGSGLKLDDIGAQIQLSIIVSIVLLVSYFAYLSATIWGVGEKAHRPRKRVKAESAVAEARDEREAMMGLGVAAEAEAEPHETTEAERAIAARARDKDAERTRLRALRKGRGRDIARDIVIVVAATVATLVGCVVLVSQMNHVILNTSLTPFFVGFIILPFITNAVEQLGAISAAFEDHMEEAMAVAAGSSVQMALLVGPILILASVLLGNPIPMVFGKTELIILTLVTFVYALVSLDGESTWLEGLQLIAFYVMVGAFAYFLPGP